MKTCDEHFDAYAKMEKTINRIACANKLLGITTAIWVVAALLSIFS